MKIIAVIMPKNISPTVQVAYAAASVPNVATKNGPLCGQQLPVGELQLIR